MKVFSWSELPTQPNGFLRTGARERDQSAPTLSENSAVTIGVFDAIHIGHRRLISLVTGRREQSVVVTFRDNPAKSLEHRPHRGDIHTLLQRLDILEALGVQTVVLIDFSEEFSKLTGNIFIRDLMERIHVRYAAVGKNFYCGRGKELGSGTFRGMLEAEGAEVTVLDPVEYDGLPVSSTLVREKIRIGDFQSVFRLLGGPFALDLESVPLTDKGGIFRIKKSDVRQLLPLEGEYIGKINFREFGAENRCLIRVGGRLIEIVPEAASFPVTSIEPKKSLIDPDARKTFFRRSEKELLFESASGRS